MKRTSHQRIAHLGDNTAIATAARGGLMRSTLTGKETLQRPGAGRKRPVAPRSFYDARRGAAGRRTSRRRRALVRSLFLLPAVLYLLAFFLYPIIYNIFISVQRYSAVSFIQNSGQFNGLENYRAVVNSPTPTIGHVLLNTLLFVGISLVFQYGIGLALAVFFSRRFPANVFLRSLILIPWLLPPVVAGTILTFMFDTNSGLINRVLTGLGLVSQPVGWLTSPHMAMATVILASIWIGIPFNMVLLYGGLQEIPRQLFEAARVDGANAFQMFRRITFPMLRNVSSVVVLLGIIYTIKAFDQIYIMTGGGPANGTQVLSTWSYLLSFSNLNFGQGAAVGNMLMAIALICAVIYIRLYGRTNTLS
jgi:multiple sugar transport system permease protein